MKDFEKKRLEFVERYRVNDERAKERTKSKASEYLTSDEFFAETEWRRERRTISNSEEFLEYARKVREEQFDLEKFKEYIDLTVTEEGMPDFDLRKMRDFINENNLTVELFQDLVLAMVADNNRAIKNSNKEKIRTYAEENGVPVESLEELIFTHVGIFKNFDMVTSYAEDHELVEKNLKKLIETMEEGEAPGVLLNVFRQYDYWEKNTSKVR